MWNLEGSNYWWQSPGCLDFTSRPCYPKTGLPKGGDV